MPAAAELLTTLDECAAGARLLWRLPALLRHPIDPRRAHATLRRRLAQREADLLGLVRYAIYGNPTSPYRTLLQAAGCQYGDFERLVRLEGIEGALGALGRRGVYLTIDEFKGRRAIVRGNTRLEPGPRQFRNPRSAPHLLAQSSGSRGAGTSVPLDLAEIRTLAVNSCLAYEARGGADWAKAQWGVPGSYLLKTVRYACFGTPYEAWFSPIDPADPSLPGRYRWSARALRASGALLRFPVPALRFVPWDDPLPIVRWLATIRQQGRVPHLYAYVSSAIRLCAAAAQAGVDLAGVQLTVTGEPITTARLAAIRRSGAQAVPDYGSAEAGGFISYGCLEPAAPDDLHVMRDLVALIQPDRNWPASGLPAGSLLITSLRPTAPLILFNVSMGDQAVVSERVCGCPIERLGWNTHLHNVRSFEKLTAGGMTFLDADVITVLEEVLPQRFGGGPTDYQLVEEEAGDGLPRLRLLVDPAVGPLDAKAVAETFYRAIGQGLPTTRVMELHWRRADFLRVERQQPRATPSGKILHLIRG